MLIMLRTITSLIRLKHEAIQEEAEIESPCGQLSFNRHLTDYVKVLKLLLLLLPGHVITQLEIVDFLIKTS